jgi:PhzF family phenazine biosynthesis protein
MKIPIYQLDAFAAKLFAGNPAAVCLLEAWPDDSVLQGIAAENNLSETAFLLRKGSAFVRTRHTCCRLCAVCLQILADREHPFYHPAQR